MWIERGKALDEYWQTVEWDEDFEILEGNLEGADDDSKRD